MKVDFDESGFDESGFDESGFWRKWFLMKVVFDENFLMKLTTFILILMNPYLTGTSFRQCCAREEREVSADQTSTPCVVLLREPSVRHDVATTHSTEGESGDGPWPETSR